MIASLLSCLLMSFSGLFFVVVVRFVVRDLCRSGCRQNLNNFYLAPKTPKFTHSILFIGRPVRATPNHNMKASSSVHAAKRQYD